MKAFVAVDRNWAIGKQGQLLAQIQEDLRRFRAMTLGKTVVYGRKTLATFPGGRPLPKRRNIVLSRSLTSEDARADYEVVSGLSELWSHIADIPPDDVLVLGGESVYRQLLPYTDTVYVTRIDAEFEGADCFFPVLDEKSGWTAESPEAWLRDERTGLLFRYVTYRQKPRAFP